MRHLREQAGQAEQALIGAALLNPSCLAHIDLLPADFVNENNREVWQSIVELDRDSVVDLVTVSQDLKNKTGRDWAQYISEMLRATPSASNARSYGDALRVIRQKIVASEAAQELLGTIEKDGMDAVDRLMAICMELGKTAKNYDHHIKTGLREAVDHMDDVQSGRVLTVPTGLTDLDALLGGLHDSDLVVIGGRPAMGKTAALLNMCMAADGPVGLISSEQPNMQVAYRLLSIAGSVNMGRMRAVKLDEFENAKLHSTMERLANSPIWVNDKSGINILEVVRQARKWKHAYGIKALYVDYIQRIKGTSQGEKRHEQVGEVVRSLKELARELDIPVVALAQVGRQVESRPCKRPHMGDLSDSSEIEKEADQVILLYRDEVYHNETDQKGLIEFIIDKNRHGDVGTVKAVWRGEYLQVKDVATGPNHAY